MSVEELTASPLENAFSSRPVELARQHEVLADQGIEQLRSLAETRVHLTLQESVQRLEQAFLSASRALLLVLVPTSVSTRLGLDRGLTDNRLAVQLLEQFAAGGEPRAQLLLAKVRASQRELEALARTGQQEIEQVNLSQPDRAIDRDATGAPGRSVMAAAVDQLAELYPANN